MSVDCELCANWHCGDAEVCAHDLTPWPVECAMFAPKRPPSDARIRALEHALAHARRCSAAWKGLAKRERETRKKLQTTAFCMWCGRVYERTDGAIRDHLEHCSQHPLRQLSDGLMTACDRLEHEKQQAEQERDEARREVRRIVAEYGMDSESERLMRVWGSDVAAKLFPVEKGGEDGEA